MIGRLRMTSRDIDASPFSELKPSEEGCPSAEGEDWIVVVWCLDGEICETVIELLIVL